MQTDEVELRLKETCRVKEGYFKMLKRINNHKPAHTPKIS